MLFSLTGLVFAFTNYPVTLRCVLGPLVVLAVFADVSLWWLARLLCWLAWLLWWLGCLL